MRWTVLPLIFMCACASSGASTVSDKQPEVSCGATEPQSQLHADKQEARPKPPTLVERVHPRVLPRGGKRVVMTGFEARQLKEAWVLALYDIDEQGKVHNLRVVEHCGPDRYVEAVKEALSQWTYAAVGEEGGEGLRTNLKVMMRFDTSPPGRTP